MSQTQTPAKFITILSIIIFVLTFLQFYALHSSLPISLLSASLMAGFTAVLALLSYAYRGYLQRRAFAGKKQAGQSIDSQQQRTVEIDLPVDIAFDLALEALNTLDNQPVPVADDILVKLENILPRTQSLKILEMDRSQGVIRAGLRGRVWRLPDFVDFSRIEILLQKIDSQTTRIRIESKANTFVNMYDLGKNLHYVNQIALYLRRESQQYSAESRLSENQLDQSNEDDEDDQSRQQSHSNLE